MQPASYEIIRDDQKLTISLARTPIIPVRQMLMELIFFWAVVFMVIMLSRYVNQELFITLWLFSVVPLGAGGLAAVWNVSMVDVLQLNSGQLLFMRQFPPFRPQTVLDLTDIRSVRVLEKEDRLALTAVPGLRLLLLNVAGQLVIETHAGKKLRFGWNLSPIETREVVTTLRKWVNAHTPASHPTI